jgi:2-polyprenyl-3-methyl-5-hydroxy-6-metoxy-1,4-benzoquinol methylase
MPYKFGPKEALNLTSRSAALCHHMSTLQTSSMQSGTSSSSSSSSKAQRRALDIGCAVGGSSFELSRYFDEVIGIDFSQHLIDAANVMQRTGEMSFQMMKQGKIFESSKTHLSSEIDRSKVRFQKGDACSLDDNSLKLILLRTFSIVLPYTELFINL